MCKMEISKEKIEDAEKDLLIQLYEKEIKEEIDQVDENGKGCLGLVGFAVSFLILIWICI